MSKEGDPRLCEIIAPGPRGDVVLVGYPVDEGVRRNGGRVGSCHGPSVVREFLRSMGTLVNPEFGIDLSKFRVGDAGDAAPRGSADQEAAIESLSRTVAEVLGNGGVPFSIGGGNDQSFGSFMGWHKAFPNSMGRVCVRTHVAGSIAVINIDAHLDVRPTLAGVAHSGSPFRQMLQTPGFHGVYAVFAAQGSQCSAEHARFVRESGGEIVWLSSIKDAGQSFSQLLARLSSQVDDIFFSFDLDAVRGSDAPGVSCSSALGLTAQDALDICMMAGEHPKVHLCDLSEFNPLIERYRTGKLVTQMFYYFAMGLARRLGRC